MEISVSTLSTEQPTHRVRYTQSVARLYSLMSFPIVFLVLVAVFSRRGKALRF